MNNSSVRLVTNGWARGARPCMQCNFLPGSSFATTLTADRFSLKCLTPDCPNKHQYDAETADKAVAAWNVAVFEEIAAIEARSEAARVAATPKTYWLMTVQDGVDGAVRNVTSTDTPARELLELNAAGISVLLLFAMPITKDEYDGFNPPSTHEVARITSHDPLNASDSNRPPAVKP